MKHLVSQPKSVLCANPDSPFCYFGWPSIIRLPDGALAMAASGFRLKHICPFGKAVLCYSRNEGQTWTAPAAVIDTPLDDRDSGLTCFGDGRVLFTSFNNTIAFQRQVNASVGDAHTPKTLAQKALIDAYLDAIPNTNAEERFLGSTYRISEDGGYTFGPIGRAPVTAPHGAICLADGTLFYVGRRFNANDSFDDGATPFIQCWKMNEKDVFEHVSDIENISDDYGLLLSCEPHAIHLPNGKIIVHMRVQRSGDHAVFTTYQSVSSDGGKHFSVPKVLLSINGGAPAHLLLHSSGILLSAYGHRQSPFGIRVMFSCDGGETWDTDWVLDDTGKNGDLGYPATVELRDGRLLTVYYENIGDQSVIQQKIWQLPSFM